MKGLLIVFSHEKRTACAFAASRNARATSRLRPAVMKSSMRKSFHKLSDVSFSVTLYAGQSGPDNKSYESTFQRAT
jgi:hypothetical protein